MRNAIIIGIVGASGIGLTLYGAIRSGTAQAALQAQVNQIEKNTERPQPPPVVNVTPPHIVFPPQEAFVGESWISLQRLQVGGYITVNFEHSNFSQSVPAWDSYRYSRVYILDTKQIGRENEWLVAPDTAERQWKVFSKTNSTLPIDSSFSYGPGQKNVSTAYGPVLDSQLFNELQGEKKAISFMAEFHWQDGGGKHVNEVCEWLQPNSFEPGHSEVWHYCRYHNGPVKPQ